MDKPRGAPRVVLTPSAEEVLESEVQRFRDELVRRAARQVGGPEQDVVEVTAHAISVAAGDNLATAPQERRRRLERIFVLYALTGVFVTLLAVGGFLIRLTTQLADPLQQISVVAALFGLLTATVSAIALYYLRSQAGLVGKVLQAEDVADTSEYAYLQIWRDLESRLRAMATRAPGRPPRDRPFSVVLRSLNEAGALSPDQDRLIRNLVTARNHVLHPEVKAPNLDYGMLTRDAKHLLEQLSQEDSTGS